MGEEEVVGSHQARVESDPLGVEPGLGPQDYIGLHNAVNIWIFLFLSVSVTGITAEEPY